ncbi:MAG: hypothetical protein JO250_23310 [Armatimonadetes bacterium]|nr:hypothetical protein [Armatimonadota bacterium]
MQFTHERTLIVDRPLRAVRGHWAEPDALAGRLSHIRAVAPGPADDLARFVICLDTSHLEFAVQRTMNTDETLCWQSLGTEFLYVLCVTFRPQAGGTCLTLTVAYDPPGFLADVAESLGLARLFERALDADLRRYADALRQRPPAELALVE